MAQLNKIVNEVDMINSIRTEAYGQLAHTHDLWNTPREQWVVIIKDLAKRHFAAQKGEARDALLNLKWPDHKDLSKKIAYVIEKIEDAVKLVHFLIHWRIRLSRSSSSEESLTTCLVIPMSINKKAWAYGILLQ